MTSKKKQSTNRRHQKEYQIRVRGIRRDPPDVRKLSRALISLAMAEAEREAQAQQTAEASTPTSKEYDQPKKGGVHNG